MKLFGCISDQNNNGNSLQELLIFCYSLYFFKTLEFVIFTQYTTLQINEINRTPTLTHMDENGNCTQIHTVSYSYLKW